MIHFGPAKASSASAAISLSLLVGSPAMAAPDIAEAPGSNAIVVTGTSLPDAPGTQAYGSILIERERLANSASGRIETILYDIAGFQQFRRSDSRSANPSAQGATLRALGGNASSRTLVLLDGVPQADPFFGYIPFNALVPDRLASVRVTRGGGNGPFGSGAVAGIIEMASANRDDLDHFRASAFYGSRNAQELSASLTPDLGSGFVSLSGRFERGDGFQTTPTGQRSAATVPAAYRDGSLGLRMVAPLSEGIELQARALYFRDDRTLRFRGADSSSEGQDASVRLVGRGPWQWEALAYLQARNFSNIVISSSTFRKSLDQRNTPSTGIGGKIELRPPLGKAHMLRIGADIRLAQGDMYEDSYNANIPANPLREARHAGGRQTVAGLFIEDDWTIGPVTVTAGARADHWTIEGGFFRAVTPSGTVTQDSVFPDRSDWAFSGRGGVVVHLSSAIALRGAAYTGFRLPTLNELYRSFVVFPITTRANAGLHPEKLKGIEAGVDITPMQDISAGATLFHNRLDDAIANITIDPVTRLRQNVPGITARGVELFGNVRRGNAVLSFSYAYSHSRVDAPGQPFDGLRPAQTPKHAASATLGWAPGASAGAGPSAFATIRYTSKQYEDDLQTDALKGALTVDAVANIPLARGLTLTLRGENLFDEKVVTRNAAGSIDLGTPITLWAGLRIRG